MWLKQNNGEVPSSSAGADYEQRHRELRDELLLPSADLQAHPLLFPENGVLVEKIGLKIATARRSLGSVSSKEWQGPTLDLSALAGLRE